MMKHVVQAILRHKSKVKWLLPILLVVIGLRPDSIDSVLWNLVGGLLFATVIGTVCYCWWDLNRELRAEEVQPAAKRDVQSGSLGIMEIFRSGGRIHYEND
ncbi:MAG: hypothetical protein K0Q73_7824 [Paenibacillus sp.]|jgi:hypothetical protein|nr:hypothetical protein [Paenibacillus sp.]